MIKDIGAMIRKRRKELGLTQQDIATFCDVNKSTVCLWEKGHIANMKRDKISRLAYALQISPADLINLEVEKYTFKLPAEQAQLVMAYNEASEEVKNITWRVLGLERPTKE